MLATQTACDLLMCWCAAAGTALSHQTQLSFPPFRLILLLSPIKVSNDPINDAPGGLCVVKHDPSAEEDGLRRSTDGWLEQCKPSLDGIVHFCALEGSSLQTHMKTVGRTLLLTLL
jgi:hypothetical protein